MSKKQDTIKDFSKIGPDPNFVKGLSIPELRQLAEEIRRRIIEATSVYGGHLASNLGAVELTKDAASADAAHELFAAGEVLSIHSDEPDLEEVFLELTGREL